MQEKIYLSALLGFLFMTIMMLFTLGFTPLDINSVGEKYAWALSVQNNLMGSIHAFPYFFRS